MYTDRSASGCSAPANHSQSTPGAPALRGGSPLTRSRWRLALDDEGGSTRLGR